MAKSRRERMEADKRYWDKMAADAKKEGKGDHFVRMCKRKASDIAHRLAKS